MDIESNKRFDIYICWWGGKITNTRKHCIDTFHSNEFKKYFNLHFVTHENLKNYIVDTHEKTIKFSKCFEYLSPVHKADYFMNYIGYHRGGFSTGIKKMKNLRKLYNKLIDFENSDYYYLGYPITKPYVPQHEQLEIYKNFHKNKDTLFGFGYWGVKKHNIISKIILEKNNKYLNENFDLIKNNKWLHPRDNFNKQWKNIGNDKYKLIEEHYKWGDEVSTYPITWAKLQGSTISETLVENKKLYKKYISFNLVNEYQILGSHNPIEEVNILN